MASPTYEELAGSDGADLVGFAQPSGDAVARTLLSKAREIVSVKDFGAVCDGATDDSLAVQKALNYCALANHPIELIVTGLCYITTTLNIDRPVDDTIGEFVIRGHGSGSGFYIDSEITLFSSTISYGSFGIQKAPCSEYTVFRSILFEASNADLDAYVVSDKLFRYRADQCSIRKIKWLQEADYVQTVYFSGCHIRGWRGTFFKATDGYDVQLDNGCMFEAGAAGFLFSNAVNRFRWVGGIFEGCSGTAVSIAGVNGFSMDGIYFEGNGATEVVLGTSFGVSRGVSLHGNKFNIPSDRFAINPYPVDLGRAYGVDIAGNYSNGGIADNNLVYPFEVSPGVNYATLGARGWKTDPFRSRSAIAAAAGTQATATVITRQLTILSVVAASGDALRLPSAADYHKAEPLTVINPTANILNIFPAPGETILGLLTNSPASVASGTQLQFYPAAGDRWVAL